MYWTKAISVAQCWPYTRCWYYWGGEIEEIIVNATEHTGTLDGHVHGYLQKEVL